MESIIYLDHAATTPLDPEALAAMIVWLQEENSYGNPSSIHAVGRAARTAVDEARDGIAALIHAKYSEIYFTGSGTEADNLALIGVMLAALPAKTHLITSRVEHQAVLNSASFLEQFGVTTTLIEVDEYGIVDPDDISKSITEQTALVSIMHANNEIGSIQPIREIAAAVHEKGVLFHTDAVQTIGLLPVDVQDIGCDILSMSAHKLYGPKGVGALYIKQGTPVKAIICGGSQEREKRAGTENVAGIVGFGKSAELAATRIASDSARIGSLRDRMIGILKSAIPEIKLNGHPDMRLPNNINISLDGVEGAAMLMNLDRRGVAASSGSACSSGSIEPSHVLKAIGLSSELAASGIRFSLGRKSSEEDILRASEIYISLAHRLRA